MADRKIYFATDITGKMIVPIVDRGQGGQTATLYGRSLEVTGTAWPRCASPSPTLASTPTTPRPRRWSTLDLGENLRSEMAEEPQLFHGMLARDLVHFGGGVPVLISGHLRAWRCPGRPAARITRSPGGPPRRW